MERRGTDYLDGETQLMIAPGYRYRTITGMVTNFHQPKSTLLLLVSAFIGDRWRDCYRYALEHGFRFLSYGDSCLFLP
jgi:S-adenosylmethionine:tRNA ribosyltransferase-isomerase